MCTVTYIPSKQGTFLVSSRDEKHHRGDAIIPNSYKFPSGKIVFPKDADAGGTWIAMHENGNAIVLLNGGMEAHRPEPPYRQSRGIVLLDLLDANSPTQEFQWMALGSIEPFTAVTLENDRLFECIWDGKQKHKVEKDHLKPHIWSSVTLYEETARSRRRQWFDRWLAKNPEPQLEQVLEFHQFTDDRNIDNNILMNREGQVYTVSITGMQLAHSKAEMCYLDLKNKRKSFFELPLKQSTAVDKR